MTDTTATAEIGHRGEHVEKSEAGQFGGSEIGPAVGHSDVHG